MIVFVLFSLLATSMAAPHMRVVNGQKAAVGAHKHQISLQVNGLLGYRHSCGGSIIAPNKVITAAHCLVNYTPADLRVVAGTNMLVELGNTWRQTASLASFVTHPQFSFAAADGFANDIGIITLSEDLEMTERVGVAELPPASQNFEGTLCRISGWGQTSGDIPLTSNDLMEANMTLLTTEECQSFTGVPITNKHRCVIETDSKANACFGDSGGPLMCGPNLEYLVGASSFVETRCNGDFPSVYTNIPAYYDWISSVDNINVPVQ